MIVRLAQVRRGDLVERLDVVGVLEEWLHGRDVHPGRELGALRKNFHDDRFPRGHRVVGVLGEQQDFGHTVGGHLRHHASDRGVAVTHRQIYRSFGAERRGEFVADRAGGDDQGRTFGLPDRGVGVGGFFRART